MLIPRFNYHKPYTLREACEIKGKLKSKARLLAGGTDLIPNMKKGVVLPASLISLNGIGELKANSVGEKGGYIRIGACATVSSLVRAKFISSYSALLTGLESLGSPLIRNMATIGGNLATARPAADLSPSLIAYQVKVLLCSVTGNREISLDDFFLGPGKTIMSDDEILAEIILDELPACTGSGYIKLGMRKALEISLVNVAAVITLDKPDGVIAGARIVMGAVGPTPLRAPTAEKLLIGKKPGNELFAEAGKLAAGDSRPIDDFRGSAEYRCDMVRVITQRALQKALHDVR